MPKQDALHEISKERIDFWGYTNTTYFDRFLRKVDNTSEGRLIESLFGSADAYIDTAGNYRSNRDGPSIIDFEEENGYDVEAIFKWYCANFEKAWRWMFPLRIKKLSSSKPNTIIGN